ncbi:hypothetical protein SAMN02745181_1263 [Rubritalea squalenifaciens DSM 18772]|uniref:PD(D/E)XK endonuclease domain-containing protein n=1 Tax=Rubritalea squalenifaciens DSM 18772 TaxID=1123071 RepID=A0A1M6GTH9_9BACT|nr:hypothetical protein [Rubritalea squalenifaciens]SHJ13274.1 hypothetical protein SAMN02745181_1263 [Rubritalea squalenifaciens DSM 18772]
MSDLITNSFRNSAAFGKRIEFYVVGLMLKQGLDVYLPLVDDDAVDAVVKRPDGQYVEVQIKARSKDAKFGNSGLFAAITHEYRPNYWFVFYSERMDTLWIMSSKEFIERANQNKNGKNSGKRTVWFNGKRTKDQTEHVKPQFLPFVAENFHRITHENPDA